MNAATTFPHSRRSAPLLAIIGMLLLCATPALHASVRSLLGKGFDPNAAFQLNEFDTVNTMNGDLSVNIPFGPKYQTNGSLSYQFVLGNNRDRWGFIQYASINTAPGDYTTDVTDVVHVWAGDHSFDVVYYNELTFSLDAPDDGGYAGTEAIPLGSAGMGWNVDFGTYGGVGAFETSPTGKYTDASGATHVFTPELHRPSIAPSPVSYTHDGSYLRLRPLPGSIPPAREIDFPDGTVKHFACVANCTNWRAQWNLEWISDPFGHVLLIERTDGASPAEARPPTGQWVWNYVEGTLPDGETRSDPYYHAGDRSSLVVVRRHRLTYTMDGNYPSYPWIGERLLKAELAGPQGDFSMLYTFEYDEGRRIMRTMVFPWIKDGLLFPYNQDDKTITVKTLTSMTLPEGGGKWQFDYYNGSPDDGDGVFYSWCMTEATTGHCPAASIYNTSKLSGRLLSVRAPTGGGYKYEYAQRGFPGRPCHAQPRSAGSYGGGTVIGLKTRQQLDDQGNAINGVAWRYSGSGYFRAFIDENHDGIDDGDGVPICRTPIEFLASTLAPNGRLTIGYYNVVYGDPMHLAPYSPNLDRADTITHRDGTTATRFLTSQVYHVDDMSLTSPFVVNLWDAVRRMFPDYRFGADAPTAAQLLRSQYASYEASATDCDSSGIPNDCEQYNLRLLSGHTRFNDDPGTVSFSATTGNPPVQRAVTETSYVESVNSDFDGLGHYRQTNTYGDLKAVSDTNSTPDDWDNRVEYTLFNPGVTYQKDNPNPCGQTTPGNPCGPGLRGLNQPWLINLYSRQAVFEKGSVGSTHVLFDPLRGYERAVRKLAANSVAVPSGPAADVDVATSASDFLTVFTRQSQNGNTDLVQKTDNYGGDLGTLCVSAAGTECAWQPDGTILVSPPGEFTEEVTYQYGAVARSAYDGCSGTYLQKTASALLPGSGQASVTTDTSGLTTTFQYDSLGRVTQVIPPGNMTPQTFTYESRTGTGGVNRLTMSRIGGATGVYVYDHLGRLLTKSSDTPAGVATATFLYTPTGRVDTETLPMPNAGMIKHLYDPFDRETSIRNADGKTKTTLYQGVRDITSTTHGIAVQNGGSDAMLTSQFDSFGRVSVANDGLLRAEYDYDASSNMTTATLNPVGQRSNTQVRKFGYDGRGVMVSATHPELIDGNNGPVVINHGVDSRGHVISRDYVWQVGAGNKPDLSRWSLRFAYDPAERLRDIWQPGGSAHSLNHAPIKKFTYYSNDDSVGNRNELSAASRFNYINDPSQTDGIATMEVRNDFTYCVDGIPCTGLLANSVTSAIGRTSGGSPQTIFSGKVIYGYDARGNLNRIDYPNFAEAPPRSINNFYTADYLTSVTEGAANLPRASLSYYLNGLTNTVQLSVPGVRDKTAPDQSGLARPRDLTWTWVGGSVDSGMYSYDAAGNISGIGSDVYRYDQALRLVRANVGGHEELYSYDGFGSMTLLGDHSFTVNSASNRVTAVVSGGNSRGVVYDQGGNIVQMPDRRRLDPPDPNAQLTFLFDPFNDMIYMSGKGIGRMFVYDANDERAGVINFGTARKELWTLRGPGNRVLRDFQRTFDAAGGAQWSWQKDYVYRGSILSNTIGKNSSGQVEIHDIHVDHLGSVRFVTGPTGMLLNSTTSGSKYMPFGSLAFEQTLPERMAFTGHERDDDGTPQDSADVDYMHARYYSLATGRFLSIDPGQQFSPERPQTWNRYSYSNNNPIAFVDATGQWPTEYKTVHQDSIGRALQFLPAHDLDILKDAQVRADRDQEHQYKHAMRNPGQSAEEACQLANRYVTTHMQSAISLEKEGNHDLALAMLGLAIHTLQDSTSPMHEGFQMFDPRWGNMSSQTLKHVHGEYFDPGKGSLLDFVTYITYQYYAEAVNEKTPTNSQPASSDSSKDFWLQCPKNE